jgi:hypothetical protein
MTEFIKTIDCPGHEFGLEPCEEKITFRYRYNPRDPDMTYDEDSEWRSACYCYETLLCKSKRQAMLYSTRVNNDLDDAPEQHLHDDLY